MKRENRVKMTALLAGCSMMFALAAPMEVFADELPQSAAISLTSKAETAPAENDSAETAAPEQGQAENNVPETGDCGAEQGEEKPETVPGESGTEVQTPQPGESTENPGGTEEPQTPVVDEPQADPAPDSGQPQEIPESGQSENGLPAQSQMPEEEIPVENATVQRPDFAIYTNPEAGDPAAPILFQKIEKVYAVAKPVGGVTVREGAGADNRAVGEMEKGALCYVIADADQEWVYIESGNVRGFVQANELVTGFWANAKVGLAGEDTMPLAKELIPAWENAAYTYAAETVYEVSGSDLLRALMLQYAQQFLGNPYVWGGTSLTNGCDCSGFVQQIYRQFGYSLPRTSREQAQYGQKINIYEAQPGDLIYYARQDGYIYHVLMYMGGGKAINAASTQEGIRISDADYSKACWATRVIQDAAEIAE